MKMTIVLDSEDPEGISDAARMLDILRLRCGQDSIGRGKVMSRLKLIRMVQEFARLVAFETGNKDFKEVEFTSLRYVKSFVDKKWGDLD